MHPGVLLERLRGLVRSLPETSEVEAWGHPNFRAGKKTFAAFEIYRKRPCIAVKLPRPDGETLLGDPRFFRTPYLGKHGWVSLWVDVPVTWKLVQDLVLRSHREVANRRTSTALSGTRLARGSKKARRTSGRARDPG